MSQDKVVKTLESLGLSQLDAQVYVFLGKRGPQKAIDIGKYLHIQKQPLYRTLKNLQNKGIITSTFGHPASFSAVQFERVLDLFVKAKMEEAQQITKQKPEVLSVWKSFAVEEANDVFGRFTVIEGRNYIYAKIKQMIDDARNQILMISTVEWLVRADQAGLMDLFFRRAAELGIRFKFLTELSKRNLPAMKSLLRNIPEPRLNVEGKVPELGLKHFTRIVIRDDEEAVFFITLNENQNLGEKAQSCLWTNSKSLVQSFTAIFEELWSKATDIEEKMQLIQNSKFIPGTHRSHNATTTFEKHEEEILGTQQEVLVVTSSEGLNDLEQAASLLDDWAKRGILVKIMAPITRRNLKIVRLFSEYCEVRHIPENCLNDGMIDGRCFFQFKNSPTSREKIEAISLCKDVFYTNDHLSTEKTKDRLNIMWENAQPLSAIKLDLMNSSSEPVSDSGSASKTDDSKSRN